MKWWLLAATMTVLAACGGAATDPDGSGLSTALQPLEVGAKWVYETSDAAGADRAVKEVEVVRTETIEGVEAAVVESRRGSARTLVWLAQVDGRIVRLREEAWDGATVIDRRTFAPGSLRTPATIENLRVGQELDGDYVEKVVGADDAVLGQRPRVANYRIEAIDEKVVTPAGEFFAVRLRKLDGDGGEGKLTWYAPGVGKVREEGGRIEVLQSWSQP